MSEIEGGVPVSGSFLRLQNKTKFAVNDATSIYVMTKEGSLEITIPIDGVKLLRASSQVLVALQDNYITVMPEGGQIRCKVA